MTDLQYDPQGDGEAASLHVTVSGRPVPQGSATIQRFNTAHRGTVVSSNKDRLLPWRNAVSIAANDAWGDHPPIDSPVSVALMFSFARPKAHYGAGRNAAVLKPSAPVYPCGRGQGDIDKLARAVLDALSDAGVFTDDSRVVSLLADKVWSSDGREGVSIEVHLVG
jgi:Holliday junction resolvase RusA-like endonuclease